MQEAIDERIKPVGRVLLMGDAELAAAAAAAVATPTPVATVMTGPQVYNAACIVCHQPPGTGGAPPVGDVAAWAPRIEQGTDTLYMHALRRLPRHEGLHAAEGRPRRSLRRRDQSGRRLSRRAVALAPRDRRSDARRLAGRVRDHSQPDGVSRGSARGSVTVKVAPPSRLLSAAMVPLCASTIRRAIVRPMPRPCDFVVTNGANNLPMISARKPGPVSRTETATFVAVNPLLIVM